MTEILKSIPESEAITTHSYSLSLFILSLIVTK